MPSARTRVQQQWKNTAPSLKSRTVSSLWSKVFVYFMVHWGKNTEHNWECELWSSIHFLAPALKGPEINYLLCGLSLLMYYTGITTPTLQSSIHIKWDSKWETANPMPSLSLMLFVQNCGILLRVESCTFEHNSKFWFLSPTQTIPL
jgi:hypothetical protein